MLLRWNGVILLSNWHIVTGERVIYVSEIAKYAYLLGNSGIYTPSNGGTLTHNLSDPNQIRQTFTPESFSGSWGIGKYVNIDDIMSGLLHIRVILAVSNWHIVTRIEWYSDSEWDIKGIPKYENMLIP